MSVVNVTKKWSGRTGQSGSKGAGRVQGYEVVTDDVTDDADVVLAHEDIPRVGDPWQSTGITYLRAASRNADCAGPTLWNVTITYEAPSKQDDTNPLDEPPEVEWFFVNSTEPIDVDIEGTPLRNSSHEPFDPPISDEIKDIGVRISWNVESFSKATMYAYRRATNSVLWEGFGPGEARIANIDIQVKRWGTYTYERVTVEIHMRPPHTEGSTQHSGWNRRIADMGFKEYTGIYEDGHAIYDNITDDKGVQVQEAVPLNGAGRRLKPAEDTYWHYFVFTDSKPFSALGIPNI